MKKCLPVNCRFDGECRRNYQAGRMDMLFNLVDLGIVPLDLAASIAGITVEEAADMLQGWIVAQQMPVGYIGED